jgi:hypothetical protein
MDSDDGTAAARRSAWLGPCGLHRHRAVLLSEYSARWFGGHVIETSFGFPTSHDSAKALRMCCGTVELQICIARSLSRAALL